MTMCYGIIGFPLSHSFSPAWFNAKFEREGIDARYDAFPISDLAELPKLIRQNPNLLGLNVTIPYKEKVLHYLDKVDAAAADVGAVNCIGIKDGILTGYNTDIIGFRDSLLLLLASAHNSALVLGNGGAARAVKYVLLELGIDYIVVSRSPDPLATDECGYEFLSAEMIQSHRLIINTTPLGMYPDIDRCPPVPYEAIGKEHLLYDLVYNPELTQFLAQGATRGARIKNGLEMLELQAEAAWRIWSGE